MQIKHLKISYKDKRGYIKDIIYKEKINHLCLIFSIKNSIRGNHYHKKSHQYLFLISGKLTIQSKWKGQIKSVVLLPNDLLYNKPYEEHTIVALEDSLFLVMVTGLRGGKDYDKDTYKDEFIQPEDMIL